MTYRNKKSGATFVTPCVCAGDGWEEVKAPAQTPKAEAKASAPASKAKGGKKQEAAADAESADSGVEDS